MNNIEKIKELQKRKADLNTKCSEVNSELRELYNKEKRRKELEKTREKYSFGDKMIHDILSTEFPGCGGCVHNKTNTQENPEDPTSPIQMAKRRIVESYKAMTGIEWCTKYDCKIGRKVGGQPGGRRCEQCIEDYTIGDMPPPEVMKGEKSA